MLAILVQHGAEIRPMSYAGIGMMLYAEMEPILFGYLGYLYITFKYYIVAKHLENLGPCVLWGVKSYRVNILVPMYMQVTANFSTQFFNSTTSHLGHYHISYNILTQGVYNIYI